MKKLLPYASKTPDACGFYDYDEQERGVWSDLFQRQISFLKDRAAPQFFDGIHALGLNHAEIPQIATIDAKLAAMTGAGVQGVPAIIPPKQFFSLLAQRKFPVATFLRCRADIDYIEEPDLFHEVFGHCPLLTNAPYCDFIERFGKISLSLPKGTSWHVFRLFWFTIEFGMIRTPQGVRAFGAGIVSSPSEARFATGGKAELVPFDLMTALRTPYRIDIVQPLYFVIDSFEQLVDLLDQDLGAAIAAAQDLGDLPARFQSAA